MDYTVANSYLVEGKRVSSGLCDFVSAPVRALFLNGKTVRVEKGSVKEATGRMNLFARLLGVCLSVIAFPLTLVSFAGLLAKRVCDNRKKIETYVSSKKVETVEKKNLPPIKPPKEQVKNPPLPPKAFSLISSLTVPSDSLLNGFLSCVVNWVGVPAKQVERQSEAQGQKKDFAAERQLNGSRKSLFDALVRISLDELIRCDTEKEFRTLLFMKYVDANFFFTNAEDLYQQAEEHPLFAAGDWPWGLKSEEEAATFHAMRQRFQQLDKLLDIDGRRSQIPQRCLTASVAELLLPWELSPLRFTLMMDDEIAQLTVGDLLPQDPISDDIAALFKDFDYAGAAVTHLKGHIQQIREDHKTAQEPLNLPADKAEWEKLLLTDLSRLKKEDILSNLPQIEALWLPQLFYLLSDDTAAAIDPSAIGLSSLCFLAYNRPSYIQSFSFETIYTLLEKYGHQLPPFMQRVVYDQFSCEQAEGFDFFKAEIGEEARQNVFDAFYDVTTPAGKKRFQAIEPARMSSLIPYLTASINVKLYLRMMSPFQFKNLATDLTEKGDTTLFELIAHHNDRLKGILPLFDSKEKLHWAFKQLKKQTSFLTSISIAQLRLLDFTKLVADEMIDQNIVDKLLHPFDEKEVKKRLAALNDEAIATLKPFLNKAAYKNALPKTKHHLFDSR